MLVINKSSSTLSPVEGELIGTLSKDELLAHIRNLIGDLELVLIEQNTTITLPQDLAGSLSELNIGPTRHILYPMYRSPGKSLTEVMVLLRSIVRDAAQSLADKARSDYEKVVQPIIRKEFIAAGGVAAAVLATTFIGSLTK